MEDTTSGENRQKRAKSKNEKDHEEDLINQLPNVILEDILSKLPINEAARSSMVSRKWRNRWTFYSGSIEFNGSRSMKNIKKDIEQAGRRSLAIEMEIQYIAERKRYIGWINKLLHSLQSDTLKGLKFWFGVDTEFNVDEWIQIAIEKKVPKLELYFGDTFKYVLPFHLFRVASYTSLCVLRLEFITVTEEMLNYLLSKCPLLETLSLVNSVVPKIMKVSASSVKLKCLELVTCSEQTRLEIFAEKLVSFKYIGFRVEIEFMSIPSLVRDNNLPQLEVLKLETRENKIVIRYSREFPMLRNSEHLGLVNSITDSFQFDYCKMLLNVSPSLWRFKVKCLANTIWNEWGTEMKVEVASEMNAAGTHAISSVLYSLGKVWALVRT